jgi:lysophospholipase L1-like esterase
VEADAGAVAADDGGPSPADAGAERPDGPRPDGGKAPDAGPPIHAFDGGSGPYAPCPPRGTPCAILALGDSITFGEYSTTGGGYRVPMFEAASKAGQSVTFVGSMTSGPATVDGKAFPQQNEGHPGFTIAAGGGRFGIQALAQSAITTYHPNIVTLMIGTNDVDVQYDLTDAPARLATLLDTITGTDPNLLLVVAQIIPTTNDDENTRARAFNAAIPDLVKARADRGVHVVGVDMYGAFTANAAYKTAYFVDALHPNDAGFQIMADVWDSVITALLR